MNFVNLMWKFYIFLVYIVFYNVKEIFVLCVVYKCGKFNRNKVIFIFVVIGNKYCICIFEYYDNVISMINFCVNC